jgi:hypothetical protein
MSPPLVSLGRRIGELSLKELSARSTLAVVSCGLAAMIGLASTRSNLLQLGIVVAVAPLVVALSFRSPRAMIVALCVWLTMLGLLRRVLVTSGELNFLGDPLLLVGPIVLLLLFATAAGKGALRDRTPLGSVVLALSLVALLEAANPLQGGITVGVAGLLLIEGPLLAFWVGRLLNNGTLLRLFRTVATLGLAVAAYGLVQNYIGFPSWDANWIQSKLTSKSYVALNVGHAIRAFGPFSSAQEYAVFLTLAFVLWLALGRTPSRVPITLAALGTLSIAIFLESARGTLVTTVAALGIMFAARRGARPVGALVGGIIAIGILSIAAGHFAQSTTALVTSTNGTSALVAHQVSGLSDPFNAKTSTFNGHFSRILTGMKDGITQPLGHGTGTITAAANKFGGTSLGTEGDPSNAAEAFGLPGLILYLLIFARGLTISYRLASRRKDPQSLAVLGTLVVTLLQWLNGDLYSVTWIIWLSLGWVDQQVQSGAHRTRRDATRTHSPYPLVTAHGIWSI